MRIAIGELGQETDTFSPIRAELSDFEEYGLYEGAELLERSRGVGPLGGFLDVAAEQSEPVELSPLIRAWGGAGGRITRAAFERLLERLTTTLRQALPVDGVFLSLHGAAAADGEDDVEGAVLEAVRAIVGPQVPVAVALDHHANVTARMVGSAEILVGHETQPHDPPATGRKAGRLLFRRLRGEIRPTIAWRKIPLVAPQDQFLTASGPMREWFEQARALETEPGVLDVSPFPMQPWLDVAEAGWAVIVQTDGDPERAEQIAETMAQAAWDRRRRFWESQRVAPAEAIARADSAPAGPILLSDNGDSVYGGAPGDSTCLIRALLERPPSGLAYVPLVDRAAVERAHATGAGGVARFTLGAVYDRRFYEPVELQAKVAAVSRGFVVDLLDRGVCDLRRTALLEFGPVRLVLLDHRSFAVNHPILYQHLGLSIEAAQMIVMKTASNFQFFERWRRGLIRVDTPGSTQSDLTAFEWRRAPRGTWPISE